MLFFVLCSELGGNRTVIIKNFLQMRVYSSSHSEGSAVYSYQNTFSDFLATEMESSRSTPISYSESPEFSSFWTGLMGVSLA